MRGVERPRHRYQSRDGHPIRRWHVAAHRDYRNPHPRPQANHSQPPQALGESANPGSRQYPGVLRAETGHTDTTRPQQNIPNQLGGRTSGRGTTHIAQFDHTLTGTSTDHKCDGEVNKVRPEDSPSGHLSIGSSHSSDDDQAQTTTSTSSGSSVRAHRAIRTSTYGLLEGQDGKALRSRSAQQDLTTGPVDNEYTSGQSHSKRNHLEDNRTKQDPNPTFKIRGFRSAIGKSVKSQSGGAHGQHRRQTTWWSKLTRPVQDFWAWKKKKRILVA